MRHLLGITHLQRADVEEILAVADSFAEVTRRSIPKVPALRGRTIVLGFFEDSTRTRVSFETAAKRLSADTVSFSSSGTSVSKGESLRDTALTLQAIGADCLVVRHASSGAPWQLARWLERTCVVNAGDGAHEHPTQALLDCWTLTRKLGPLDGMHLVIVGDVAHSRVARSNVAAFTLLGADVTVVAPRTLLAADIESWARAPGSVKTSDDLDRALASADAVYLLRMQLERQHEALVPSLREYTERFGLTRRRLDQLAERVAVLHPGPMNRGVEIAPEAADDPRSLILSQVEAGVNVRMAVLFLTLGGQHAVEGVAGE
ncbi:MAG: aspartate carbamoyltransferase catalytic subunit [Acidimicrobiia bacterium]|nr:aspartate carbamoyltransferase catalytic subunit [Acidimicrobiia bacterium]